MAAKVMIAVLVLLGFVAGTFAVQCEVCVWTKTGSIETGSDCKDPYVGDNSIQCGSSFEYCGKIQQSYSANGVSVESISRLCPALLCTEEGESTIEYQGQSSTLTCCKGDNCNSGAALMPALVMLVASLLFTAFF